MSQVRLTRQERREQTREQLTDAAERRFKNDGFHATSLDAIAEEAGYTKGAVYSNFASKEALFFAVYERHVDQRTAELETAITQAPSKREEIRAAVAGADPGDDGWIAVFFEFWAHVLRHDEHRARFAELHRRGLEPVVRSIAATGPALAPELLATAQLALGNGMQLERLTRPEEVGAADFQDAMWLFTRAALRDDTDREER
jgi:AcrR family transcriptional regulator